MLTWQEPHSSQNQYKLENQKYTHMMKMTAFKFVQRNYDKKGQWCVLDNSAMCRIN